MCTFGSGRSALAAIAQPSAITDSSPRRDVITSPWTKTWSPRSTLAFQRASSSSPTDASESIACSSVPSPSRRVAKQSLPVLRRKITRPVTPTVVAGGGVRRQVGVGGAHLREGVGAVDGDGVGLVPAREHLRPLVPAHPHLLGQVGGLRFVAHNTRG